MHLWDVYALRKRTTNEYRALAKIPNGESAPDTKVDFHDWVRIAKNVSEDEAYAVMDQYPHAARAKC